MTPPQEETMPTETKEGRRWTPRWVFHERAAGLAPMLVPYCTPGGGSASEAHDPQEGEILVPLSELEAAEKALKEVRTALGKDGAADVGAAREALGRHAASMLGRPDQADLERGAELDEIHGWSKGEPREQEESRHVG